MAAAIVVGCGSGPAATPADRPASTEFAIRTPTPSAAEPSATPAATPTVPATTPLPTMDPALIGTWEGELDVVRRPVELWALRYTVAGPCAVLDERCGTWERHGLVTQELDWAPWANLGDEIQCGGQLRYQGSKQGAALFLAAIDTAGGSVGCEVEFTTLAAQADGTVRLDNYGGHEGGSKGGNAILSRVDASPAPSGS